MQPLEEETLEVLDSIIRNIGIQRQWMSNGTVVSPPISTRLLDDSGTGAHKGLHGFGSQEDPLIYSLSDDAEETNHYPYRTSNSTHIDDEVDTEVGIGNQLGLYLKTNSAAHIKGGFIGRFLSRDLMCKDLPSRPPISRGAKNLFYNLGISFPSEQY